MKLPVFLDHHSTTPVDVRIADKVRHTMVTDFGNPSSADHLFGDRAAELVNEALAEVRRLIAAPSDTRVITTSGATEALNLAVLGLSRAVMERHARTLKIGISSIEHSAARAPVTLLQDRGWAQIVPLVVDDKANLDLQHLEEQCRKGLDLVCVMAANNEVGTIQPIQAVGHIVKRYGGLLLVDGSQGVGRTPLLFDDWNLDLLALTAHKIYGPKGVGALVCRTGLRLEPLLYGGGQQQGLRPGTLNVPGIVGLGEAARLRRLEGSGDEQRIQRLRDALEDQLCSAIPDAAINGNRTQRLAGNLNISVPVPARAVIARVRRELAISTGTACSSGIEQPSHVLQAMGLPDWRRDGALRVGLGRNNTEEEIDFAASLITTAVGETLAVTSRP